MTVGRNTIKVRFTAHVGVHRRNDEATLPFEDAMQLFEAGVAVVAERYEDNLAETPPPDSTGWGWSGAPD